MNKAMIMGRLTRDPEMKTTQSGVEMVTFTVAVDRRFKDASGERQADFINCIAWRKTAEHVARYYSKGKPIIVVGSIQTRSWDGKDGQKRYATEVIADEVYFTINDPRGGDAYQRGDAWEPPAKDDEVLTAPAGDESLPFDMD